MPEVTLPLPEDADSLAFGRVRLNFSDVFPVNDDRGLVSWYHFKVQTSEGVEVGHLNFRVGKSTHVQNVAGHIGYAIHQGHGYAFDACHAVVPVVRRIYSSVILTTDPENRASIRTIEKLGARFLEQVQIPEGDPAWDRGECAKLRYRWTLPALSSLTAASWALQKWRNRTYSIELQLRSSAKWNRASKCCIVVASTTLCLCLALLAG